MLVLVLAAVVASGCRLDLTAVAQVEPDGGGTVAVEARFDPTLLAELDAIGVDPTAELEGAVARAEGWSVSRVADDDGGLTVIVARVVDAPAGFGQALRELGAGLAPGDPALLVDLEVEVSQDGASSVAGTASLRAPETSGAVLDGEPLGPAGADLAAIVAEAVAPRLQVTLPGTITSHDADVVEGRTMIWELDGGRTVTASAQAPTLWESLDRAVLLGVALVLLAAAAVTGLLVLGRRGGGGPTGAGVRTRGA